MSNEKKSMALVPSSFGEVAQMSQVWAKASTLNSALRNKPEDVALTVLTGMELGLLPMASLRMINIIDGKPSLAADTLVAIVLGRRDVCEYFICIEEETNETQATYETKRVGAPRPRRMTFTLAQAKAMNLAGRDNWKKQQATMLRHRSRAALARDVYPDIVGAVYTDDEARDFTVSRPAASVHEFKAPTTIDVEVVEPDAVDVGLALLARINDAESIGELGELIGTLKAYEGPDRAALRKAYSARRAKLLGMGERVDNAPARTDEEAAEAAQ